MAIHYRTQDGRVGILDLAVMLQSDGAKITGVQNGIVYYARAGGVKGMFSLADWSQETGNQILTMDSFNLPQSALPEPPSGLTALDQLAFYTDGADMEALAEMFPTSQKLDDGRVVVLDVDGFWKEMWSPLWAPPAPPEEYQDRVTRGAAVDTTIALRLSAVQFVMALAGVEPKIKNGNFRVEDVAEALKVLARNAPEESKIILGRFIHQTIGLDPWKWNNALVAPGETVVWLKQALRMTSFDYRMKQAAMAEVILKSLHEDALGTFVEAMRGLMKVKETKKILINMKTITSEFISFMVGLDLIRDISKTTGLQEWIELSQNTALDPSKLPPMPEFVPKFVRLLKWVMPMARDANASVAQGRNGLEGLVSLMVMIDDCIFSLAYVPDSSAKQKMFMGLKRIQTQIENKLAFFYQPDPLDNKDGQRENVFMLLKERYKDKREAVYRLVQVPKESWNNTFLEMTRDKSNLELFYQSIPQTFAKMIQSFVAMDAAYDMQPWVDADHARRTNDAFSQLHESFGLPPPEAGYLAKNSPRAALAIIDSLAETSGMLLGMNTEQLRDIVRSPNLLANMLKMLMAASISREVGTVEMLGKMGIAGLDDPMASPDPFRIWEDPDQVQRDQQKQIEEIMGQMVMEQAMQAQQQQQANMAQQAQMQGQPPPQGQQGQAPGGAEMAGPGPNPPSNVIPMAR